MKITVKVEKEFDVKTLRVMAGVIYWEDTTVNGVEDTEGDLIPCREGDNWCPIIDLETGIITNWEKGKKAEVHYKVCDAGEYFLQADDGSEIQAKDYYVPNIMCPNGEGYGDYIIMNISEDGKIEDWKVDFDKFIDEDED